MLKVGGFTPFTTIDYPGKPAAVVFCQGCPWRCCYCHNRHLLDEGEPGVIAWNEILSFLDRRRGLLDAVVFSGGEPTMQRGLEEAVLTVREMGFLAGLHTGGAFPEALAKLLPHLDWVGMDIKAPFPDYERVTGVPGSGESAEASSRLIRERGIPHEFHATPHHFLQENDLIRKMRQTIEEDWGSIFRVRPFLETPSPVRTAK